MIIRLCVRFSARSYRVTRFFFYLITIYDLSSSFTDLSPNSTTINKMFLKIKNSVHTKTVLRWQIDYTFTNSKRFIVGGYHHRPTITRSCYTYCDNNGTMALNDDDNNYYYRYCTAICVSISGKYKYYVTSVFLYVTKKNDTTIYVYIYIHGPGQVIEIIIIYIV